MNIQKLMPTIGVLTIMTALDNSAYADPTTITKSNIIQVISAGLSDKLNKKQVQSLIDIDEKTEYALTRLYNNTLTDDAAESIILEIMDDTNNTVAELRNAYLKILEGKKIGNVTIEKFVIKDSGAQWQKLKAAIEADNELSSLALQKMTVTTDNFTKLPDDVKDKLTTKSTKITIMYKKNEKPQLINNKIIKNNPKWKCKLAEKLTPDEIIDLFQNNDLKLSSNNALNDETINKLREYYATTDYTHTTTKQTIQTDIDKTKTNGQTKLAEAFIELLKGAASKGKEELATKLAESAIQINTNKSDIDQLKDALSTLSLSEATYLGYKENSAVTVWKTELNGDIEFPKIALYNSDNPEEQKYELIHKADAKKLLTYITQAKKKLKENANAIQTKDNTINQLTNQKNTLTQEKNQLQLDKSALENQNNTLTQEQDDLRTQAEEAKTQLEDIQYKMEVQNEKIQEMKQYVDTDSTKDAVILNAALKKLSTGGTTLNNPIKANQIQGLEQKLQSKDTEINNLKNQISTLKNKDKYAQKIVQLEQTIQKQATRIQQLESDNPGSTIGGEGPTEQQISEILELAKEVQNNPGKKAVIDQIKTILGINNP